MRNGGRARRRAGEARGQIPNCRKTQEGLHPFDETPGTRPGQIRDLLEARAADVGLTPQQHQALLAIRGCEADQPTIGYVAERLVLKPHSVTGLIDRLESMALVTRHVAEDDRRRALLQLTPKAHDLLAALSMAHREEIRRMRPTLTDILDCLD